MSDPARQPEDATPHGRGRSTRRSVLIGGGLAAAGVGAGLATGFGLRPQPSADDQPATGYPLRGPHQSGITTPAQQQLQVCAFDVSSKRRADLVDLLKDWTLAAERMMRGEPVGEWAGTKYAPPADTGETEGLPPSGLTITIGVGASLFRDADGRDRFGLAARCPAQLAEGIPRMAAERLDPAASGGDLVVQACAEDPLVTLHAMHNMIRIAFGRAVVRWTQLGYGRTSTTTRTQPTPRNLFGFKDGTANLKAEDAGPLQEHLWIQPGDDQGSWAAGGTYMCMRKIRQMLEVWDELSLREQERIVGRSKLEGAPLSGGEEFTAPDFALADAGGQPLIDKDSHVAVVHPNNNGGRSMLRRGYNYTEGVDSLGRFVAGLFFIAFVRDPQTNFIPILSKMANDRLTEYLQHVASSMFLVLPGAVRSDEFVGQRLLDG